MVTLLEFHPLNEKLELTFDKRRKQYHRKVVLNSFHSNVRSNGSFRLTRKLEPPYAVRWLGCSEKTVKVRVKVRLFSVEKGNIKFSDSKM